MTVWTCVAYTGVDAHMVEEGGDTRQLRYLAFETIH
jgi:hypothetical protein